MKIHNLMEKIVIDTVEEIFSNEDFIQKAGCCNTESCKLDVICYVLNRIPPKYTTSSRGLAHIGNSYIDNPQSIADVTALVNEGIRQVGTNQRPSFDKQDPSLPELPVFNFPIIKGRVYDGKTFAYYSGSQISLKINGSAASMSSPKWNNPSELIEETEGSFLFWPMPVKAESPDEKRGFSLSIEINADGYKPVKHFIDLELTAENHYVESMEVSRIYKVEPIYLFGLNEPEEIIP